MISLFFSQYKRIIISILIIALISAVTFSILKFIKYEQNVGYQKAVAEYTARDLITAKAVAAKQSQLMDVIKKAQDEATGREQKIKELSTTLTADNKRLRNTITQLRGKVAGLTADAARRQADAALDVSDECSAEYTKLAEEAARLSSSVILLQEAWPR